MKKLTVSMAFLAIGGASDAAIACSWFEQCPAPVVQKTKKPSAAYVALEKRVATLEGQLKAYTIVLSSHQAQIAALKKGAPR